MLFDCISMAVPTIYSRHVALGSTFVRASPPMNKVELQNTGTKHSFIYVRRGVGGECPTHKLFVQSSTSACILKAGDKLTRKPLVSNSCYVFNQVTLNVYFGESIIVGNQ